MQNRVDKIRNPLHDISQKSWLFKDDKKERNARRVMIAYNLIGHGVYKVSF